MQRANKVEAVINRGNGWKACSVVIMAGEYIRLSPKRKFEEQPRESGFTS